MFICLFCRRRRHARDAGAGSHSVGMRIAQRAGELHGRGCECVARLAQLASGFEDQCRVAYHALPAKRENESASSDGASSRALRGIGVRGVEIAASPSMARSASASERVARQQFCDSYSASTLVSAVARGGRVAARREPLGPRHRVTHADETGRRQPGLPQCLRRGVEIEPRLFEASGLHPHVGFADANASRDWRGCRAVPRARPPAGIPRAPPRNCRAARECARGATIVCPCPARPARARA